MDRARDFRDTERTQGWVDFKGDVEKAIAQTYADLSTIDIEGKTTEQIGAEYLRMTERVAGLSRALQIAEDIKSEESTDL